MNKQFDDENNLQLKQDDINELDESQLKSDFKPNPVLFLLTIGGTIASLFCYLILDLRIPAILLIIFIALINYLSTKREYKHELKKAEDEESLQQSFDDEKQ